MTNEEILAKWNEVEKHVATNLPKIWLRFSIWKYQLDKIPDDAETTPKKVYMYYNVAKNTIHFHNEGDEDKCVDVMKWCSIYNYVEVSKKYDDIILASSWEIPLWHEVDKLELKGKAPFKLKLSTKMYCCYAINKDKTMIGRDYTYSYHERKYVWSTPKFGNGNEFQRYGYAYGLFSVGSIGMKQAFIDTFGIGLLGGNTYLDFSDETKINRFLSYNDPKKRNTKNQGIIDELLKIELKVPKMEFKDKELICVASKVDETYSALRWFMPTLEKKPYEISRLYVSKKNHYFCRKNTCGEYIVLTNKLKSNAFDASKVIIQDKNAFDGTKLEYFSSIYKELKPKERAAALYMLTVFPEYEKLYKFGLGKICRHYLTMRWQYSWPTYIKDIFGEIKPKEKNITKILGFNKYQLDCINKSRLFSARDWGYYVGKEIKRILNVDDCASIDNATFDAIFNVVEQDDYRLKDAVAETIATYSVKVALNMIPILEEHMDSFIITERTNYYGHSYTSRMYAISLYTDYIRTVKLLDNSKELRPQFDSVEDILRMHDDAAAVYNLKRDAVELAKFNSRADVWKKWAYDKNEKYVVIAPTKPDDLACEGITLHHCVKSYIGRVSQGMTNIMFIRERTATDAPFFTVEIGNKGTLEQVHGFANRNANTEPGLEDFLTEWCKACKIKTTNFNKVR